ncbi:MAG: prepilin-type N-terminal cleavage/methylation domain-containing protein [Candidatus Omnitrophica bacterium]|nr:prepilin-type N-terminal cleavage/methylation domain-containing protein [Candidatus Omnitrophota bacterium]
MKRSFTLIELLIVIVIIGILASLAIPQYTKFTDQAKGAEAVANLGALRRAVNVYYAEVGDYPRFPNNPNSEAATTPGSAGRPLLSTVGLGINFIEAHLKWDYAIAASPPCDHVDAGGTTVTDYQVYALPSNVSDIDTTNPAEMAKFWHGHMYKGQPVGKIINKYPLSSTHSWADHQ